MTAPGINEPPATVTLAHAGGSCHLLFGTCGYSYLEWADSGFYPAGTKTQAMLSTYGRSFSAVELNYTWYQMARAEPLRRMVEKAPAHLQFGAKLTRTLTHERDDNWRRELHAYRDGIEPLRHRLLAILVQLPPGFDRTITHRRYLAELLDGLAGLPVAVEFRHRSWAIDKVFAEFEHRRVSLVMVDAPELPDLFPPLAVVTNPELFYVRLHGRNLAGWRSGSMQKKFDYDYRAAELRQWCDTMLAPMARQASRGIIFFNNHVRAQAPRNALMLAEIVREGMA
jgi:uncharacterized protein YecE (DUF72 family)